MANALLIRKIVQHVKRVDYESAYSSVCQKAVLATDADRIGSKSIACCKSNNSKPQPLHQTVAKNRPTNRPCPHSI